MIIHPGTSVLFLAGTQDRSLQPFFAYLDRIPHIKRHVRTQMPADLSRFDVIVTSDTAAFAEDDRLTRFVLAGGGWLGLVQLSDDALPDIFGVQPGPVGPENELRVLFQDRTHPLAVRLPDAVYLQGRYQPLHVTGDTVDTLLYADWHYRHRPVLTHRFAGIGRIACTTLQDYTHPTFQQILYRLIRFLGGHPSVGRSLGVGLVGYPPWLGKLHGLGTETTSGLELAAVCDINSRRLSEAEADFPGLTTYVSAEELINDPKVVLVVVSTPPNIHARLSLKIMEAGKHVVCEKPLALTRRETDLLEETAAKQQVHLSCHQNRRWDVDYLAIQQALMERRIGDLFYMETFVGGYGHPCGYWHSHAEISGGTAYDWGGHYLDWIVSLIPGSIRSVVGTRQKRVWRDVTNADQERIQIRFAGGQEAEFLHSDIAAVKKPKWYLLGTEGAIVGNWRNERTYEIDPVVYFRQHDIPDTEMIPDLVLHRRHVSGQILAQQIAVPQRMPYLFHRNLADHLLTGEPIAAPLHDSVRVVAILEAAARSAANDGREEFLDV